MVTFEFGRGAPFVAGPGIDGVGANILAIAKVLADYMNWETMTSRPTWAVLMKRTGLPRSTVAEHLRWLRQHGLLGLVEHGTTPQYSPGVLTLDPDGKPRNHAAVYLLIAPTSLRLVAQTHPDDVGAEWVETGPLDAVEAAATEVEAGDSPTPTTGRCAPPGARLHAPGPLRAAPRPLACGRKSDPITPRRGVRSPHTRARDPQPR